MLRSICTKIPVLGESELGLITVMKIELKKINAFCTIIAALTPECRLLVTPTGISALAVDTANVGMVSCSLPKESFQEYSEEKAEIGMDLPKWKGIIGILKDGPITIDRDKDGRLIFSDGRYTYTLTPLDPTTVRKRPNVPNIGLPASVVLDAKEYQETIKAMGVIGDKIKFEVDGERFTLSAEGDTDKLRKELTGQPQDKKNGPAVSSLFSLDYLKDTARAMKDASTITLHLGQDHPCRFDFELEGIEASFLIAPRIEQEG